MTRLKIADEEKPEFIGQIIDLFEDFLDEKGIVIPNEDRDMESDGDNCANIYGMDYGELSDGIETILDNWAD